MGYEDLIKNTVTASFGRGQDNQVSELISVCETVWVCNYNKKEKVEPMTLKAFVKEQVEGGKNYHSICSEYTSQIKRK